MGGDTESPSLRRCIRSSSLMARYIWRSRVVSYRRILSDASLGGNARMSDLAISSSSSLAFKRLINALSCGANFSPFLRCWLTLLKETLTFIPYLSDTYLSPKSCTLVPNLQASFEIFFQFFITFFVLIPWLLATNPAIFSTSKGFTKFFIKFDTDSNEFPLTVYCAFPHQTVIL